MDFPKVVLWSVPLFILLMVAERVSYLFHRDDEELGYGLRDTATSITMGLGSLGWDVLWGLGAATAATAVYLLTPLRIDFAWWALPLFLIAQDFCYYWSHRGHHMIRILWASHVVHHSSQMFNLSTALRQPWTGFTSWIFYLPHLRTRTGTGHLRPDEEHRHLQPVARGLSRIRRHRARPAAGHRLPRARQLRGERPGLVTAAAPARQSWRTAVTPW